MRLRPSSHRLARSNKAGLDTTTHYLPRTSREHRTRRYPETTARIRSNPVYPCFWEFSSCAKNADHLPNRGTSSSGVCTSDAIELPTWAETHARLRTMRGWVLTRRFLHDWDPKSTSKPMFGKGLSGFSRLSTEVGGFRG